MSEVNVSIEIESIEVVMNVKIGEGVGKLSLVKLTYEEIKEILGQGLSGSKAAGVKSSFQEKMDEIISRSLKTVDSSKLPDYATVAGQLGVKGSAKILAFTEALAKLEAASNISGEEGGE